MYLKQREVWGIPQNLRTRGAAPCTFLIFHAEAKALISCCALNQIYELFWRFTEVVQHSLHCCVIYFTAGIALANNFLRACCAL